MDRSRCLIAGLMAACLMGRRRAKIRACRSARYSGSAERSIAQLRVLERDRERALERRPRLLVLLERDVRDDPDDRDDRAVAAPPIRPPLRAGAVFVRRPRPEPERLPPPDILFSVAQARRSASRLGTPRLSYPSSM